MAVDVAVVVDGAQWEKIESKVFEPPDNISCDREDPISAPSLNPEE